MDSNYPTFELGLFDDIQELDNVSEMVETSETSDKSKDQQLSESATGQNNRFANLSERDLEKIIEDKESKKTKKNTNWCVKINAFLKTSRSTFSQTARLRELAI